jgi:hypothetical protein
MAFSRCLWSIFLAVVFGIGIVETPFAAEPAASNSEWKPREFPLIAWGGPPKAFNNLENWNTLKECNFTMALADTAELAEHRKALDICHELGLPLLVNDRRIDPAMTATPGWQKTVTEILADYKHPGLEGLYGWDEPSSDLFAQLGAMNAEFRRQAPNLLFTLNTFPNYATPEQLGSPTYREHIEKYVSIIKPPVLCFDHYAVMADGTTGSTFFENLAAIRECAQKHHLSPWIFILSAKHGCYAEPALGDMRWQAYCSLAYGMKGILFWLYWPYQPISNSAIVDLQGKPTQLYPIVQKLNGEIRAIGKTLLGLESTGVYHTGQIPTGGTRLPQDAPLLLPPDKSLVVGHFEDTERTQFVLMANADPKQATGEFSMTLHPEVKRLFEISKMDGVGTPVELIGNQAVLDLEAGDGRLFRLESDFKYPEPKPVTP